MYSISEFIFYFNLGVSFYKSLGMVLFCEKHRTQRTSGGQPVGRSLWEIELHVCIWAAGLKKMLKPQGNICFSFGWLHAFQILPREALMCLPASDPKLSAVCLVPLDWHVLGSVASVLLVTVLSSPPPGATATPSHPPRPLSLLLVITSDGTFIRHGPSA